jgi:hypothetical protein
VTRLHARLDGPANARPEPALCDAWTADGARIGDELPGLAGGAVIGRWPGNLEIDAVTSLVARVGPTRGWDALAAAPTVVQGLAERARLKPLDLEILRHLQHLQQVCHRPRLHLRVEEERLPVARARRIPVRAVAELVSHPEDWEHRTLRSIQPARVLARLVEDEWNLYENRVAVRLVDHLLAYLARRLDELRKIEETLARRRDHSDQARTSYRRAERLMRLWAGSLDERTSADLRATKLRILHAQRDLQVLLDSPLYQRVPRRADVAHTLRPTNILVNDPHYRKVAALWRSWLKYGHQTQETRAQRLARRQREAAAWDAFVLHLVVRAFADLAWTATPDEHGWTLKRRGYRSVRVAVDAHGVIHIRSAPSTLRLLPLCAAFSPDDGPALAEQIHRWDGHDDEVVLIHAVAERRDDGTATHAGPGVLVADPDRELGWSFAGRATLLGCSPWGIDCEERMARLLHVWLRRAAAHPYPAHTRLPGLPNIPQAWTWLQYTGSHLVALREPSPAELAAARDWAATKTIELTAQAQQAKLSRQAVATAPRASLECFTRFLADDLTALAGQTDCPVCGHPGRVELRPGRNPDGADATWWATCIDCTSEWGLRTCTRCNQRFAALVPHIGLDLQLAANNSETAADWPDRVLGRDVWAQPCRKSVRQFRCSHCGTCAHGDCGQCRS